MPKYKGGCQCGAVVFEINGDLGKASICHCRMCQKAFGNFYAPLVSVTQESLNYPKEKPKYFQSSNLVKRGFCDSCGTPLTYEAPDGIAIAIGAFDKPNEVVPVIQFGTESKIIYVDNLHNLPNRDTLDDMEDAPFLNQIISYQRADED
ncbi:GFA family protein [Pseudaquidulcibacter saccharophilus]|uniref:GFA family protein n=1 Tax=Pseudaquidulcibacter saccharophilus TaxID=2831900 RepID=UPI001EFEF369|nr:GFA family protein [Pseudaquidulcibacter saccharophilus]